MEESGYSRDFKNQISRKVLSRIEKRYLSTGSLTEAEMQAFNSSEGASSRAKCEKVMTGSVIATCGFIVSRVPLMGALSSDQILQMPYPKRRQALLLGRMAKISAYALLTFAYYKRHVAVESQVSDDKFLACVTQPIASGAAVTSPSFYKRV